MSSASTTISWYQAPKSSAFLVATPSLVSFFFSPALPARAQLLCQQSSEYSPRKCPSERPLHRRWPCALNKAQIMWWRRIYSIWQVWEVSSSSGCTPQCWPGDAQHQHRQLNSSDSSISRQAASLGLPGWMAGVTSYKVEVCMYLKVSSRGPNLQHCRWPGQAWAPS